MKRISIIIVAGITSFVLGLTLLPLAHRLTASERVVGHANWASPARSVAEQAAEADLVVRVQVQKVDQVRKLKQALAANTPGTSGPGMTIITPFTDTKMRVVEVFKGSASQHITVMQTGGVLPAADGDPAVNQATDDDPLFVEGSEHVLFLTDISADRIHGKGRQIYRIVNSAGRYEVTGASVASPTELEVTSKPTTLAALVGQIRQTLGN